ncbi:hypothetical protein CDAR_235361 [Caerostris darwini]|uniref:Uncharacterized protein n=1 Tax=Caerostris darwini TaxID=1538125 RepID=A0AAV4VPW4_9ARAC|nr:hypothetical protein CDAR_235361 [Caerostris darwini]
MGWAENVLIWELNYLKVSVITRDDVFRSDLSKIKHPLEGRRSPNSWRLLDFKVLCFQTPDKRRRLNFESNLRSLIFDPHLTKRRDESFVRVLSSE